MIRILIAEDSPVIAQLLQIMFADEPDMEVVGIAPDGGQAVEMARDLSPDLITMDVMMPVMDGLEATKRIMDENPTPIVIVSSHVNNKEMDITFQALGAGALSVQQKPENVMSPDFARRKRLFVETIRSLASVRLVSRWPEKKDQPADAGLPPQEMAASDSRKIKLLGIGASTGGPNALKSLLKDLPAGLPFPVVIAQHISRGFTVGMVDWLNSICPHEVKTAVQNEALAPGHVYFAPDSCDISVLMTDRGLVARLSEPKPEEDLAPSVNVLFDSVAGSVGYGALCALLTGMGDDGARGLLAVKKAGGITVIESEESCVVYGMPQAAKALGASETELSLSEIGAFISGSDPRLTA